MTKKYHVETEVADESLKILKRNFGYSTIQSGKEFTFLVMNIKITEDKKIEMETEDQINKVLETFEEEITEDVASPAALRQLMITENLEKLMKEKAKILNSVTAKFLYIIKRVRPDL